MARPANEDLERVREELTCAVCTELFTNPKTLPCLHTFCEECLVRSEAFRSRVRVSATQAATQFEVECPLCRYRSTLEEGIEGIKTNFTYSNLVANLRLKEVRVASKPARANEDLERLRDRIRGADLPGVY